MGHCLAKPRNSEDGSDHNIDFSGGNVQVVTTKEGWEQMMAEAKRDGRIHIDIDLASMGDCFAQVIANFSASWCGPCKMIAPFYIELSMKHPSIMFLVVDVDELIDFSTSLDIKATPTFFFLKDGQQLDKLVGANKPELEKKVVTILDSEVLCHS